MLVYSSVVGGFIHNKWKCGFCWYCFLGSKPFWNVDTCVMIQLYMRLALLNVTNQFVSFKIVRAAVELPYVEPCVPKIINPNALKAVRLVKSNVTRFNRANAILFVSHLIVAGLAIRLQELVKSILDVNFNVRSQPVSLWIPRLRGCHCGVDAINMRRFLFYF